RVEVAVLAAELMQLPQERVMIGQHRGRTYHVGRSHAALTMAAIPVAAIPVAPGPAALLGCRARPAARRQSGV
ncbi:MAG: hypothetical protein ACREFT_05380, partial [Acetobacteraceae bacterium]